MTETDSVGESLDVFNEVVPPLISLHQCVKCMHSMTTPQPWLKMALIMANVLGTKPQIHSRPLGDNSRQYVE